MDKTISSNKDVGIDVLPNGVVYPTKPGRHDPEGMGGDHRDADGLPINDSDEDDEDDE